MHYKVISTNRWSKIADIMLVILGFVGMVYTTTLTIMSWVRPVAIEPLKLRC